MYHHQRVKHIKEPRARDWDMLFKRGVVATVILSSILLIINLFYPFTQFPLLILFPLPILWAIIGMIMARKYSSAEMRDMHRVSDYVVLSLCGYFAAFFLTLYALKSSSWINFVLAIGVYLILYYYSWKSLRRFMEQKNIPFNWLFALGTGALFLLIAMVSALLMSRNVFWAIAVLVAGIIAVLIKWWPRLVRQFGYAQRYNSFIHIGLAFNYFSLVLWAVVFVLVAGIVG